MKTIMTTNTLSASAGLKQTALDYFKEKPAERDGVMKAYYAYHENHFRLEPKGHNFRGVLRESKCVWCGRSREQVRHDDLPPHCLERPQDLPDTSSVILSEEVKFQEHEDRSIPVAIKILTKMGDSEETRRFLYETHGIRDEVYDSCVDAFNQQLVEEDEYAV